MVLEELCERLAFPWATANNALIFRVVNDFPTFSPDAGARSFTEDFVKSFTTPDVIFKNGFETKWVHGSLQGWCDKWSGSVDWGLNYNKR